MKSPHEKLEHLAFINRFGRSDQVDGICGRDRNLPGGKSQWQVTHSKDGLPAQTVGRTCLKSWRSGYSRRIFPAGMFSELATEYREMAEQCFVLAAAAWHLEAKTAWLDLAQKWLQLALLADKYAAEQPDQKSRGGHSTLLN